MEILTERSFKPSPVPSPLRMADHDDHDQGQYESCLFQFYEALVIFSMLGRPTRPTKKERPRPQWHEFLDHLSWLCDFECGGKTVTSIAVETSSSGPVFWVAMNKRPRERAVNHLKWVLSELDNLCRDHEIQAQDVQTNIFLESVRLSRRRVKYYRKNLIGLVHHSLTVLEDQRTLPCR